jgi:hypothetical protein
MTVRWYPDLRQTRRDPAKGPPDLAMRLPAGQESEKGSRALGALQE